jgi:serine/threonine protein phosphatase PrpC
VEVPQHGRFAVWGAWLCHTGKVRKVNEDACLAGPKHFSGGVQGPTEFKVATGPWVVAVSDGIGGHRAGAEASREVVTALAAGKRITPNGVSDILHRLNKHLCERGKKERDFAAMGATVAGLGCGGKGLFAFNVGDSRVYRQEGPRLVQLTRDDSEAEDLIDLGLLERSEGKRPGFLHALTQAIGGREEVEEIVVHTHPVLVTETTRFLICSDGVTDMLHAPEIEEIMLAKKEAGAAVVALFAAAMEAGGMDNITIAVVDVEPV